MRPYACCLLLLLLSLFQNGDSWFVGNGRSTPPRDLTPPTITCPSNIHEVADDLSLTTIVNWDEDSVIVKDETDDSVIRTRTGPAPGSVFSEGVTTIIYHARDNGGNYVSCSFNVTVEVIRCSAWPALDNGWRACNVSHDMRKGSVCRFGCYEGHVLHGTHERTCLGDGEWDDTSTPFCNKTNCAPLEPQEDQVGVVNINCTNENIYGSQCTYTCIEGYDFLPGSNILRLCDEDSVWLGSTPICFDTASPVFPDCPEVITGYAEPGKSSGTVMWSTPNVTDNRAMSVVAMQTYGPQPGSNLDVGQYELQYTATDPSGNIGYCEILLIVKQISCPSLEQYPYTKVLCPKGRILGAACTITCEGATTLSGPDTTECVLSADETKGEWNVDPQPYCQVDQRCPVLDAPENGQLKCEVWELGRFCQMTCDKGFVVTDDSLTVYDEIQTYYTLLVCDETDTWLYEGDLPKCQEVEPQKSVYSSLGLEYNTTRNCMVLDELMAEISNSTLEAIDAVFYNVCISPNCTVNSDQILCDDDGVTSNLKLDLTVDLDTSYSAWDLAFIRSRLNQIMLRTDTLNALSMDIDGVMVSAVDYQMSQLIVECGTGSGVDLNTLQCVNCKIGYFYNSKTLSCDLCPLGSYQDELGQSICKNCEEGTSTAARGATSMEDCEPSCPAGTYSTTGVLPCTACDLGTYTDRNASTECTTCPDAKITLTPGVESASECQDFDLVFPSRSSGQNGSSASVSVPLAGLSSFTLTFWVTCSQCHDLLTLEVSGDSLLTLTNEDVLKLNIPHSVHNTGIDISSNKPWNKVTMMYSMQYLDMYVGSVEVIHWSQQQPLIQNLTGPVNLIIGGSSFTGRFSQVHMWSHTNLTVYNDSSVCFTGPSGDILNWREFFDTDGAFVIASTKCDEFDGCASLPCENNGECTDTDEGFLCSCPPGYTSETCETNIDDCVENICNSGICVDRVDSYSCNCTGSYSGNLCQTLVVDGSWTDWEISGPCSVTCGIGLQQRTRVCENPAPKNGGVNCTGQSVDFIECGSTNSTCPNKCTEEPSQLDYGEINCHSLPSNNETYLCNPECHQGYEFDNDLYVNTSGLTCGPETGYTWNNANTDNPYAQIPSCTAKTTAKKNILYFKGHYSTLTSLDKNLQTQIVNFVIEKISQAGCVSSGKCNIQSVTVAETEVSEFEAYRTEVVFTATVDCVPSSFSSCYNPLQSLTDILKQGGFTVTYGGTHHNVTRSMTDGISECASGYIPVFYYCVPCGKGTYASNNYCVLCARGTYQDEIGQTSCKACPEGATTEGLMTRARELCNVSIVPTDTTTNWQIITVATLSGVVCFVLIAYIWYIVYDRWIKEPFYECIRNCRKVEKERPPTPPPVVFTVKKKRFFGKPVRRDSRVLHSDDAGSQHFGSDIMYDVVEDFGWRENDLSSMDLPPTPEIHQTWSPPRWKSSPMSTKHHDAWR